MISGETLESAGIAKILEHLKGLGVTTVVFAGEESVTISAEGGRVFSFKTATLLDDVRQQIAMALTHGSKT